MFFNPLLMDFIFFSESPNPIRKPFLNISASSLQRLIKADIFLSVWSMTVSPCARLPKSTALPPNPEPPPVEGEEVSPVLSEEASSRRLIWSKPIRARISFAAFFAAFPTPLVALLKPLAAEAERSRLSLAVEAAPPSSATGAAVFPDCDFFPLISSVKALKAFASVESFPSTVFITLITGVNRLISPCPSVAFRESICSFMIRTWFAHESEVRAKSPVAAVS